MGRGADHSLTNRRNSGPIKKFGVDIGFTKEAHMVWLVFAPGNVAPGACGWNHTAAQQRQPRLVSVPELTFL